MKHTPKLWVSEIPKQYGYIALNMDGPICIAQLNHTDGLGNLAYKTQLARAHEIANAVNMHDELVEAIQFSLDLLDDLTTEDFSLGKDKPMRDRLQQALSKAKEGRE